MLREDRISLNVISEQAAFELLQRFINKGHKIANVYIDTVGSPAAYKRKWEERFKGRGISFRVESKADSLFKVVSAASIVAKVNRDRFISNWQFKEQVPIRSDYGSGYPGDAQTVAWLKEHCDRVFRLPTIARFSWKTCDTLAEKQCCPAEIYNTKLTISHEYLNSIDLQIPRAYVPKISQTKLHRRTDDLLGVTGNFDL